jgi:hypothetical protein
MEDLQAFVRDLHAILVEATDNSSPMKARTSVQSAVRTKVKEQLSRRDLRIPVELVLLEILHEFDGFDSAHPESRAMVLEDAEKLLNRIESLLETDMALNTERMEMPPPPPIVAELMEEEVKTRRERENKEYREEAAERHISADASRRPVPRPQHAPQGGDQRPPRRRSRGRRHGEARPQTPAGQPPPPMVVSPPSTPAPAPSGERDDRGELKFQHKPAAAEGQPQHREGGGRRHHRRPPHRDK